jgi:hypothetical protein
VTRGNIAELATTAFVALLIVLLSVRTIGYTGEQRSGGESVSQLPLKDKAFSIFADQNPPFELRPENGVSRPAMRGSTERSFGSLTVLDVAQSALLNSPDNCDARLLSLVSPTPRTRTYADRPSENSREMTLVAEAALRGHIR